METLQNQIAKLKAGRTMAQLKAENKKAYYTVKGLASKLSKEKAIAKGNFITKEHLTEYKGLIIWILKNKVNYRGYLNLRSAMNTLLNTIENENIVYITSKSIKSIVTSLAISAGLEDVECNLREASGLTVLDNSYGNQILESFGQHRLNVLS